MTKIVDSLFGDMDFKIKWYEKIYYKIFRISSNVKYFFRKLYQQLKYGFPLEQSWNFSYHHSKWVVPRLKKLKEISSGHPSNLTQELWFEILDKIIWSFENLDNAPKPIYSNDYDHRYEVIQTKTSTLYTPLNKTGTIDYSPVENWNKKIKEGLSLFAEYYQNLWD